MHTTPSASISGTRGVWGGQPHASHGLGDLESVDAGTGYPVARSPNPAPVDHSALAKSLVVDLGEMLSHEGRDADSGDGRAAGGPEEASLDLIEGHNSEVNSRILLKTECYPSGAVRAVVKQVDVSGSAVAYAGTPLRVKRERSEQVRVESSVQRTRKSIRQRCMAFRCDRLLTLTYRENMQDRERCYRDTVRFIEKARSASLLARYVAVPELQKRGAYHVHIAIRGYMPVMILRRIWREVVGRDNGNIDISYQRRGASNPWRIAAYLSKYIGKAVAQAAPGERTFWASEWGHLAPICRALLLAPGLTLTQVASALMQIIMARRAEGGYSEWDWWSPKPRADGGDAQPPPVIVWAA